MTSYLRSNAVVDDVEDVIALLSSKRGELSAAMVEQVRRMHANSDRAKLVVELALGTMRARTMGKYRPGWLFTRRMAEQATHPVIAAYHAGHYRERGCVLDICTGPGIDAAALASVVERVVTIEADEVVCAIATGNLLRSGVKNAEVLWGRWPEVGTVDRWDGVWADPSRRRISRN